MYLHILQSVLPTQHTPKSKLDKHTIYRHTKHLSLTNSQKKQALILYLLDKITGTKGRAQKVLEYRDKSLNLQFIHNHEQKVSFAEHYCK